jgi:hypothetical protein
MPPGLALNLRSDWETAHSDTPWTTDALAFEAGRVLRPDNEVGPQHSLITVRKDSVAGTSDLFSSSFANHMLSSCAVLERCASIFLPRDEGSP